MCERLNAQVEASPRKLGLCGAANRAMMEGEKKMEPVGLAAGKSPLLKPR